MKAFLDQKQIDVQRPTLAAALAAGAAEAERQGRIVVEVRADGRSVTGDELESPSDTEGAAEISMVTAEPRALVSVTLGDAAEALDQARPTHSRAAELVQQGQLADAIGAMETVLGAWGAARAALDQGSLVLGQDLADGIEGAKQEIDGLASQLAELQRALADQDWSSVADVLAYELEPRAGAWSGLLRAASENAKKAG